MTWKFRQIKPQKAKGRLLDSMWDDPNYIAEEKYDGDRRIAQFCAASVRFTGTRESVDGTGFVEKTDNLPHLSRAWKGPMTATEIRSGPSQRASAKLEGTVLDGEMVVPFGREKVLKGGLSKYVTSVMGSGPEEAIRKQRLNGYLCYVVFDCLWYKGADMRAATLQARRNYAEQAVREWGNAYVALATQVVGVGKRAFYDLVTRRGGEGVVLKHVASRVGDAGDWIKVKKEATADVVVMGFTEGKGKYEDLIGGIAIGQYRNGKLWQCVRPGSGVSGMTDALRKDISRRPEHYMGWVMTIKHNGREPTGMFRHPRFNGWRSDKSSKDCVYDPEET